LTGCSSAFLTHFLVSAGDFNHRLFVISHDDTFERDTDHVVRVVKEDGASRVVEA
jgi:DNA repair exonuclease SbcCD ATPase subunit